MIPHKTARGAAALNRLQVFEGVPPPYDKKKRMVVPQALRILRLKPGRKYCTVGRLSHEVGWKYQDVVARSVPDSIQLRHPRYYTSNDWRCPIFILNSATDVNLTDSRNGERSRDRPTTSARKQLDDTCWKRSGPHRWTKGPRSNSPSMDIDLRAYSTSRRTDVETRNWCSRNSWLGLFFRSEDGLAGVNVELYS